MTLSSRCDPPDPHAPVLSTASHGLLSRCHCPTGAQTMRTLARAHRAHNHSNSVQTVPNTHRTPSRVANRSTASNHTPSPLRRMSSVHPSRTRVARGLLLSPLRYDTSTQRRHHSEERSGAPSSAPAALQLDPFSQGAKGLQTLLSLIQAARPYSDASIPACTYAVTGSGRANLCSLPSGSERNRTTIFGKLFRWPITFAVKSLWLPP